MAITKTQTKTMYTFPQFDIIWLHRRQQRQHYPWSLTIWYPDMYIKPSLSLTHTHIDTRILLQPIRYHQNKSNKIIARHGLD